MATITDIVTRLERRIIDLPTAVSAESQRLVEEAHRELQELHNFHVMERRESRTTTAGDPSLGTIGTDEFKEYLTGEKPFWTDDLGFTRFLTVSFNESEVRRGFNQDATLGIGPPSVLLHRHQTGPLNDPADIEWKVYPVPDGLALTATGEYTIEIPYYRFQDPPAGEDWFTLNAEEFLLASATAEAFALNWDEARYIFWRQKAYGPLFDARGIMGGDLARVINRDKRQKVSGTNFLVPYADVNAPKLRL